MQEFLIASKNITGCGIKRVTTNFQEAVVTAWMKHENTVCKTILNHKMHKNRVETEDICMFTDASMFETDRIQFD